MSELMRAVIIANGVLDHPETALAAIRAGDILIAADGGGRHCRELGLRPAYLIGDFDSLTGREVDEYEAEGVQIIRHPARKDFTDLELAIRHAVSLGAEEVLVLGALGARWDQSIANLLLPAAEEFSQVSIRLLDGSQEVFFARPGKRVEITGKAGDTISLIPIGQGAYGVTTLGLEYPLAGEMLPLGTTRGISNVLLREKASVWLEEGLLLCVAIHADR